MQEDDIDSLLKETMAQTKGITYLDYVTHDKKHQLFADCSCFVFPSKAEGFGMPLIEVMKFGKPMIVGNLDIYDEIIGQHGDRFDLNGTEQHQIDNLAEKMLHFNSNVDEEAYKEIIAKYAPEKLGRIVRDFILTIQKG
ncbi:MAG: glycosyltransferase [Lachnospira sp.]